MRRYIPSGLTILGLCCGGEPRSVSRCWVSIAPPSSPSSVPRCSTCSTDASRACSAPRRAFGAQLDLARRSRQLRHRTGDPRLHLVTVEPAWRGLGADACVLLLLRHPSSRASMSRASIPIPRRRRSPISAACRHPAAACLILLPMLLAFQFSDHVLQSPFTSAAIIALMSALMVSRVPTLSLKHIHVLPQFRGLVIAAGVLMLATGHRLPMVDADGRADHLSRQPALRRHAVLRTRQGTARRPQGRTRTLTLRRRTYGYDGRRRGTAPD